MLFLRFKRLLNMVQISDNEKYPYFKGKRMMFKFI